MVSFGEFTANVSLANFTSVLEIAFSISFIFFIFEISPWMKTRSRPLFNEGRKLHLWQRLLAGKKNRSWKYLLKFYFILSIYYPSIYVLAALEIILLVITSVDALCSLGLLIVLGFYPSVSIDYKIMILILSGLFIPVPYYVLGHIAGYHSTQFVLSKLKRHLQGDPFKLSISSTEEITIS